MDSPPPPPDPLYASDDASSSFRGALVEPPVGDGGTVAERRRRWGPPAVGTPRQSWAPSEPLELRRRPAALLLDRPERGRVRRSIDNLTTIGGGERRRLAPEIPSVPQHLLPSAADSNLHYYRVVYRGVVALLSEPVLSAPKSTQYVGYGEIFASRSTVPIDDDTTRANSAIRVDSLLTGGYAVDAAPQTLADDTPKHSNTGGAAIPYSAPSLSHPTRQDGHRTNAPIGYLLAHTNGETIVEPLHTVPHAEEGLFRYKIVSTTPLPVLTGPSRNAPKTKAVMLPGTVHEVSLRITVDNDGVIFLKLSHRRGWMADRKIVTTRDGQPQSIPVVQELISPVMTDVSDDGSISVSALSVFSTFSIAAPSNAARRRHRPPRRRKDADANEALMDKSLPRHIGGSRSLHATNLMAKASKHNDGLSSNVSILSDESSFDQLPTTALRHGMPSSTDVSHATTKSIGSVSPVTQKFYLLRVTAPRGLKILDAPQFQVNTLIHRKSASHSVASPQKMPPPEPHGSTTHQSIFHTMAGRSATTATSKSGNPAVFDSSSKTRVLPRGAFFEASKRMENTGAFSQGAGLIKLSDNSGWAIVPRQDELDHQYRHYSGGVATIKQGEASRAYQEVGNAVLESHAVEASVAERLWSTVWIRVRTRAGLAVTCPPPVLPLDDDNTSPTSSRESSAITGSNHGSNYGPLSNLDSDVASSVGSAFLDAVFRTPKKSAPEIPVELAAKSSNFDKMQLSTTIACGVCLEVEKWTDRSPDRTGVEYARLRGGQGWLPLSIAGKATYEVVCKPDVRWGSFWFRVQTARGVKVRWGPCQRAPPIKSGDGSEYFRFECGEFLRASEILTVFSQAGDPIECFAKLYRNRHVRWHTGHDSFRQLPSLTTQAEWVQVFGPEDLFLDECAAEPRIERHAQGWRYNVVPDAGVAVRKGPSFAAETTRIVLLGGESVVVTERVSPAGDETVWLRLKDVPGWVHDVNEVGEQVMLAHSLRHRSRTSARVRQAGQRDEIAYNTIVARLFHSDVPGDSYRPPRNLKGSRGHR